MTHLAWLSVTEREAPLIVSLPHTGTDLTGLEPRLVSPWLARKDADWWIDQLYGFAAELGATMVHTSVSRTVIDVNRDPSGASLYPGQATTGLCPSTTFDGEPLYRAGEEPGDDEIAERRAPLLRSLSRRACRPRSRGCEPAIPASCSMTATPSARVIPRLFDGELPVFNLGTNGGASCRRRRLRTRCESSCDGSGRSHRRRMAASRAAGSHAPMAGPRPACTRSRWSSHAAAICASPRARSPSEPGRHLTTQISPRRCEPR